MHKEIDIGGTHLRPRLWREHDSVRDVRLPISRDIGYNLFGASP